MQNILVTFVFIKRDHHIAAVKSQQLLVIKTQLVFTVNINVVMEVLAQANQLFKLFGSRVATQFI